MSKVSLVPTVTGRPTVDWADSVPSLTVNRTA
jgi:hypothetical protein